MIPVQLYTRNDCPLCDETLAHLESLKGEFEMEIKITNIDSSPALQKQFGEKVPVVMIGPYMLKAPHTRQDLQITLAAAQRGIQQDEILERAVQPVAPPGGFTWTRSDGILYWLSKHYLALVNILVFIYVGLPVLAPVLMRVGAETPARVIYRVYGAFCHQYAFRSFFLFGEQAVYPREDAHMVGVQTFEAVTGYARDDVINARAFTGTPELGFKLALCERDMAIYGSILLFGLLFALFRRQIPPLPWYLWVALALIPIGLDGVSQLISQPPINLLPYRESTPLLRVLTGSLFGTATAAFGIPVMEDAQRDTVRVMDVRRKMMGMK